MGGVEEIESASRGGNSFAGAEIGAGIEDLDLSASTEHQSKFEVIVSCEAKHFA